MRATDFFKYGLMPILGLLYYYYINLMTVISVFDKLPTDFVTQIAWIFFVFSVVYFIIASAILMYHWSRYALKTNFLKVFKIVYFAVSIILLIVSLILLITIS